MLQTTPTIHADFTSTAAKEEYGKTDRKAHHVANPRSH